jgi:hypothetical protein
MARATKNSHIGLGFKLADDGKRPAERWALHAAPGRAKLNEISYEGLLRSLCLNISCVL